MRVQNGWAEMEKGQMNELITSWLSLSQVYMTVTNELEAVLQANHQLSLNEFYVLLFLSNAEDKKLKLHQLQNMVGLSQSAMSRLVSNFEAKGCGALQRHHCENDRRAIYTSLTPIGEEKLEKALITFNLTLENAMFNREIQNHLQNLMQQTK